MRDTRRSLILPLLGVLLGSGLAVPATAEAQYFGRNKVQYDTFDFRILKTEHFDIYYYPEEEREFVPCLLGRSTEPSTIGTGGLTCFPTISLHLNLASVTG